jgi:hypothetical protein
MECLPANWEAINNEKGSAKRAKVIIDVGKEFLQYLKRPAYI